jgi:hypothetical protein
MDIHPMDVKNVFLNGVLKENIYLCPPPGFSIPPGNCLHLKKSIYGLKQAPRVWYCNLLLFIQSLNFKPSPADPCLFISANPGWCCFVHVYVNDLVIVSHEVDRFKKLILERYTMEDLGQASLLLGMKISYSLQTFVILPKQKTTVWVRQTVKFIQQNGSVMKIEQN